jgi:hypothetical protein
VVAGGRGFLIDLSVGTAFLRAAVTAGGNVRTTFGGKNNTEACFCRSFW